MSREESRRDKPPTDTLEIPPRRVGSGTGTTHATFAFGHVVDSSHNDAVEQAQCYNSPSPVLKIFLDRWHFLRAGISIVS